METFLGVKAQQSKSRPMSRMIGFVERYICSANIKQMVVNMRRDEHGNLVTQAMFDRNDIQAHVCPFVRDSIDRDLFWIEESALDGSDPDIADKVETLLRKQIQDFKDAPPAYDPLSTGHAVGLPELWKAFLTFFPFILHKSSQGPFPLFDDLHKKLKSVFVSHGLMLGQFYAGCPEEAVYNKNWRGPLISIYP